MGCFVIPNISRMVCPGGPYVVHMTWITADSSIPSLIKMLSEPNPAWGVFFVRSLALPMSSYGALCSWTTRRPSSVSFPRTRNALLASWWRTMWWPPWPCWKDCAQGQRRPWVAILKGPQEEPLDGHSYVGGGAPQLFAHSGEHAPHWRHPHKEYPQSPGQCHTPGSLEMW